MSVAVIIVAQGKRMRKKMHLNLVMKKIQRRSYLTMTQILNCEIKGSKEVHSQMLNLWQLWMEEEKMKRFFTLQQAMKICMPKRTGMEEKTLSLLLLLVLAFVVSDRFGRYLV